MLVLSKLVNFFNGYFPKRLLWAIVFVTVGVGAMPLGAFDEEEAAHLIYEENLETYGLKQAHSLADEQILHEIILKLVELKWYLQSRGCEIPDFKGLLDAARSYLREQGVEIEDAEFNHLQELFEFYEDPFNALCDHDTIKEIKHKKKRHKKDVRVSGKTAIGFLKFMGGALLCLIPVPIVQGAGASLAVLGVNDMMNAAREESKPEEPWVDNQRIARQVEQPP